MTSTPFTVDKRRLEAVCLRFDVQRLAIFGSALRGELGDDSDIDVLVEFRPEARVGLRFITLQNELSLLFGRRVDLSTPAFLSRHFRDRVVSEALPLYEAA